MCYKKDINNIINNNLLALKQMAREKMGKA